MRTGHEEDLDENTRREDCGCQLLWTCVPPNAPGWYYLRKCREHKETP